MAGSLAFIFSHLCHIFIFKPNKGLDLPKNEFSNLFEDKVNIRGFRLNLLQLSSLSLVVSSSYYTQLVAAYAQIDFSMLENDNGMYAQVTD